MSFYFKIDKPNLVKEAGIEYFHTNSTNIIPRATDWKKQTLKVETDGEFGAFIIPVAIFVGSFAIGVTSDYYCELNGGKFYLPSTWTQNNTFNFSCAISAGSTVVGVTALVKGATKVAVTKYSSKSVVENTAKSLGKSADDVAILGNSIGKIKVIITDKGYNHILERHTIGGVLSSGKSVFNNGVNIKNLINDSQKIAPTLQSGGNYQRIVKYNTNIGIDRTSGKQTNIYTVITDKNGNLVTAFPGTP